MNRAVVALLLLALPTLSVGQTEGRILKPEIRVGDSWTYRGLNVLGPEPQEYETRVSLANGRTILAVATRKSDGKEFDSSWTSEWNAVSSYTGFIFRPSSGYLRFPMQVGDSYEVRYDYLRPRTDMALGTSIGTANVIGWETVQVPAGSFRAMKVIIQSVARPTDGSSPANPQFTFWYSPVVRRWVKLQVVGTRFPVSEELLEYKLNEK